MRKTNVNFEVRYKQHTLEVGKKILHLILANLFYIIIIVITRITLNEIKQVICRINLITSKI